MVVCTPPSVQTHPIAVVDNKRMHRTYSRGVTLIELMLVLGISAILISVATAPMQTFTLNREADRLIQELQLDLMFARNHAITMSQSVRVRPLNGGWHVGWQVILNNGTGTIIREKGSINRPMADAGVITSTFTAAAPLEFDAQGRTVNNGNATVGTFTVDVPNCTGDRERTISINFIGQIVTVNNPCQ